MDGMTSGSSALPASSGYQSQSAACASPGSAQRSPSWSCGGRPHADRQTAATLHTAGKEKQEARIVRPEKRGREETSQGPTGFHRTAWRCLPFPPTTFHQIHPRCPWAPSLILRVHRLCPTVGPFFLDLVFCPSLLTPGFSSSQTQHHAEVPATL